MHALYPPTNERAARQPPLCTYTTQRGSPPAVLYPGSNPGEGAGVIAGAFQLHSIGKSLQRFPSKLALLICGLTPAEADGPKAPLDSFLNLFRDLHGLPSPSSFVVQP